MIAAESDWHNGYWKHAKQIPSPNCEARPEGETVDLVVLHNISLPPFQYQTGAVEALFTNTIDRIDDPFARGLVGIHVSSHFFIARNGEITQFVSCNDMAYHAGISQFKDRSGCNRFSIGIEIEGCDFEPFDPAQYHALFPLLTAILQQYPIRAICGHEDIAPGRKTDPGHFFDWDKLIAAGFPIDRKAA